MCRVVLVRYSPPRQMIMVAHPDKPFEYTAKNDPRRHAITAMYEDEIDALYEAVNETTQADLTPPASWNYTSAKTFVRAVVERVMDRAIGDHDDLFQNSCDRYYSIILSSSRLVLLISLIVCKQPGSATPFYTPSTRPRNSTRVRSPPTSSIETRRSPRSRPSSWH